MSTSYKVNVNDSFEFDIDMEAVSLLDAVQVQANEFHILDEKKTYKASIISSDFNQKKYTIAINNTSYTVSIANALDLLIKEMGFEAGLAKQVNAIKAPMPGLILEISVVVGQVVKENDNLIILGAMKMENSFLSPRDGVIKSISVVMGDAVDKGQLLIEFE
jgi:biotin carboxyl carrier protein